MSVSSGKMHDTRQKLNKRQELAREQGRSIINRDAPSLTVKPPPLIIGHRGAAAVAPENTLASFARAIGDGADGIEFDVRLAADGAPVVIHDASLRRTSSESDLISQRTSKDLRRVDVGAWFNRRFPLLARDEYSNAKIPLLEEVFEFLQSNEALAYVELKCERNESYSRLVAEVARLIDLYSLRERVVIESFMLEAINEVKWIDECLRTAALFEPRWSHPAPSMKKMIERAQEAHADELALHRLLATRRNLDLARRHEMNVVVWTVDNPLWLTRAGRAERVRALITNDPARMRSGLAKG